MEAKIICKKDDFALGLGVSLTGFTSHEISQSLFFVQNSVAQPQNPCGAFVNGQLRPYPEGLLGGLQGQERLIGAGRIECRDQLFGSRIDHIERGAVSLHALAVYILIKHSLSSPLFMFSLRLGHYNINISYPQAPRL
ncbi:hypothetical protein SDC9_137164 [bioreactor metagenome]|uniref:Uncharacterized protein n=1 Tax=bioreactor metagenome TaxID=1076179 RepID=A0A645DLU3_9ZZZZ